jgi:hypothetical protein
MLPSRRRLEELSNAATSIAAPQPTATGPTLASTPQS